MIAVEAEELVDNRTRCRAVEKWDGQLAVLALFHGSAPVIHKSAAVFCAVTCGRHRPCEAKYTEYEPQGLCDGCISLSIGEASQNNDYLFTSCTTRRRSSCCSCMAPPYVLLYDIGCVMTYVLLPAVQTRWQDGNLVTWQGCNSSEEMAGRQHSLLDCRLAILPSSCY